MQILDEEQDEKNLPFSKGEEIFSLLFSEKIFIHSSSPKSCIYLLNLGFKKIGSCIIINLVDVCEGFLKIERICTTVLSSKNLNVKHGFRDRILKY